ncbi:2-Cys peroxiredoxin [Leuconostoc litchii]|uniref:Thiol peroxidase n=1 Tax=Leuconostoc litchii TaxID=1981069 RepID=A0A6P2CLI1_9LACO|nr:thiol peroxidase [Leuconostoc litchii]TYC46307.1 thiol peroxidase [Leuconostoc litchii]GMA70026.1 2-Cys peroxiredoxin [Leuconostoc litchii]
MNVLLNGDKVALEGDPIKVGDKIPHFKLVDQNDEKVKTADLLGKVTLISVVPDLNTDICSLQTRRFNQSVDQYSDVNFITISTNTVDEQRNWCAAEGVHNLRMLSDEQESFGYATKLYVPDTGFDTRSIFIIDASGTVLYSQIVPEISDEPDYDAALAALSQIIA